MCCISRGGRGGRWITVTTGIIWLETMSIALTIISQADLTWISTCVCKHTSIHEGRSEDASQDKSLSTCTKARNDIHLCCYLQTTPSQTANLLPCPSKTWVEDEAKREDVDDDDDRKEAASTPEQERRRTRLTNIAFMVLNTHIPDADALIRVIC